MHMTEVTLIKLSQCHTKVSECCIFNLGRQDNLVFVVGKGQNECFLGEKFKRPLPPHFSWLLFNKYALIFTLLVKLVILCLSKNNYMIPTMSHFLPEFLSRYKSCKGSKESGICPIIPFRLYQWQEIRSEREKCGKYVE